MRPQWHVWQPRYELQLFGAEAGSPLVVVWSRHRIRALAVHSKRLEERSLHLKQARLVLYDRWRRTVVRR